VICRACWAQKPGLGLDLVGHDNSESGWSTARAGLRLKPRLRSKMLVKCPLQNSLNENTHHQYPRSPHRPHPAPIPSPFGTLARESAAWRGRCLQTARQRISPPQIHDGGPVAPSTTCVTRLHARASAARNPEKRKGTAHRCHRRRPLRPLVLRGRAGC